MDMAWQMQMCPFHHAIHCAPASLFSLSAAEAARWLAILINPLNVMCNEDS